MRVLITISLVLMLGACATAYQPEGFGGGFSETQLDKNVFRVSFRGNGVTLAERAEELALLRGAEIALKNGFTHFVIIDGNTAYRSSIGTFNRQPFLITKPSTTNTIMCFTEKPRVDGLVYDAQFVFNSLAQKYGVPPAAK